MIIDNISIIGKPQAFKDRKDIEYINITIKDIGFTYWHYGTMKYSFQIPKGNRDLSDILCHLFTDILPMKKKYAEISISKVLLNYSGFKFKGGTLESTNDISGEINYHWSLHSYSLFLKKDKILSSITK